MPILAVPLPVPDAPLVTDIQLAPLVAVHAHQLSVVIAIVTVPPSDPNDCAAGEIEKPHGAASCAAVNVWLAIVAVAVRAPAGLGAMLMEIVPFPVPDSPLVIVSDGSLLTAVHEHQLPVVTLTIAVPPPDGIAWVAGEMEKLHPAAACVTVKVWSAIVTVPVRSPAAFAAIETAIVPLPHPDAPAVIVIHGAFDVVVQLHVLPLAIATLTTAPFADTSWLAGEIE